MTDTPIDASRFFADDEELVFAHTDAADVAPAGAEAAAAPAAPRRPRKKAAVAAPDAGPAPAAVGTPAFEEPATVATTPDIETAPPSWRRHLVPAALILSMLSSAASLGGVIAVGRTLADVRAARADAEAERAVLARVPAMTTAVDRAATSLAAAAARPAPAGAVSADELRRQIDGLRVALAARQPEGMSALVDQSRGNFSEIATRLDRIEQAVRRPAGAPR